MKKILSLITILLLAGMTYGQTQLIHGFDEETEGYWGFEYNESADENLRKADLTWRTSNPDPAEGTGSMAIDYAVHNAESWGGYSKIFHWNPDSNAVYDWSKYENVSFWFYTDVPASEVGRVHVRFNLYDVSDAANGNKTYATTECEFYYSFNYQILDDVEPGWKQIVLPLEADGGYWNGEGFNRTGWAGIEGNNKLDLDKIKGFDFEISVNGSGNGDVTSGIYILDNLHLTGARENPWLIFNGKNVDPSMAQFTWNEATIEVVEGGGIDPLTNSLLYTQGMADWSGGGWNVDPAKDLAFRWDFDSLKFAAKTEGDVGTLRFQFESGADGKVGLNFDPINDGAWHEYSLALKDVVDQDGTTNFNPGNITVFQMMGEGNAVVGNKVWFDFLWTGNPIIDLLPPAAPADVVVAPGEFVNLVAWSDAPFEENETYDVYVSSSPITTVEGLELVAGGIVGGEQNAAHSLLYPAANTDVTYYYAVICTDSFGNKSEVSAVATPTTNTAKGVAVISPEAPANFVADGDISEWANVAPIRMFPEDGSGHVVMNTKIDGDNDLSVNAYIAVDENNLYFAFDATDDVVFSDTTGTLYIQDSPDLFIGLYDWRGEKHTGHQRGEEPDYQLRFNSHQIGHSNQGDARILGIASENYAWEEKILEAGYVIEAKLSFEEIAAQGGDNVFKPIVGMRIPLDFSVNDNDGTADGREGIMALSRLNDDNSWSSVSYWTNTWIGDQPVDVEDEDLALNTFKLYQNYPNPFNPSTNIKFNLVNSGFVTLKVYNVIGQEVASLINREMSTGIHEVNFDASLLSTGIYIYKITTGSFAESKKMMLIK